jgi:hypothetical protein
MQDCDPGNANPVVHDGDPIRANATLVIHRPHPKSTIMARPFTADEHIPAIDVVVHHPAMRTCLEMSYGWVPPSSVRDRTDCRTT